MIYEGPRQNKQGINTDKEMLKQKHKSDTVASHRTESSNLPSLNSNYEHRWTSTVSNVKKHKVSKMFFFVD